MITKTPLALWKINTNSLYSSTENMYLNFSKWTKPERLHFEKYLNTHVFSISFRIKAFRFCPLNSCCSWLEQWPSWATVGGVCGVGRTLDGNVCYAALWTLEHTTFVPSAVACLLMFLIAVAASYVQAPLSILSALRPGGRIELMLIPQLISILILLNTDTLWRW